MHKLLGLALTAILLSCCSLALAQEHSLTLPETTYYASDDYTTIQAEGFHYHRTGAMMNALRDLTIQANAVNTWVKGLSEEDSSQANFTSKFKLQFELKIEDAVLKRPRIDCAPVTYDGKSIFKCVASVKVWGTGGIGTRIYEETAQSEGFTVPPVDSVSSSPGPEMADDIIGDIIIDIRNFPTEKRQRVQYPYIFTEAGEEIFSTKISTTSSLFESVVKGTFVLGSFYHDVASAKSDVCSNNPTVVIPVNIRNHIVNIPNAYVISDKDVPTVKEANLHEGRNRLCVIY